MGSLGLPGGDPGLRLTGVYSAGNFSLTFSQTTASVACGTLLPQPLPYSVARSGNQLVVRFRSSPNDFCCPTRLTASCLVPGQPTLLDGSSLDPPSTPSRPDMKCKHRPPLPNGRLALTKCQTTTRIRYTKMVWSIP